MIKTLNNLRTKGVILRIVDSVEGNRLIKMGFIHGKEVTYIRGINPIEVQLGDGFFIMRKEFAKLIEVNVK